MPQDFNPFNSGRVQGKDPFHTNSKGDFPHREGPTYSRPSYSNHQSFKGLDAFSITLNNLKVNTNCVSWSNLWDLCLVLDKASLDGS